MNDRKTEEESVTLDEVPEIEVTEINDLLIDFNLDNEYDNYTDFTPNWD